MERKSTYTTADCLAIGLNSCLKGKVVILNHDIPERQMYFCFCGNGVEANSSTSALFLVSRHTGEFALKNRNKVIGVLKPELLPDSAKLQFSQIRPMGALDIKNHEPKYSGYSFLPMTAM